jgi:predicted dehydrogenase
MLHIGLIGVGAEWERAFGPALAELRRRLRVRCVYAPVATRAEQAAAELDCEIADGMLALLEREEVRAVLVLDSAWYAQLPAQLACQAGKPAFIAAPLGPRLPIAEPLLRHAAEAGITLMADFRSRYTPATSRLRELIATRLGHAMSIVVEPGTPEFEVEELLPAQIARELLASTIDWCANLVGTSAVSVRSVRNAADGRAGVLEAGLEFRRSAAADAPTASIRIDLADIGAQTNRPDAETGAPFRAEIRCTKGRAVIEGPRRIRWESEGESRSELLESDRGAVQVMLDHFTRRVVGGLIPVPTLDDAVRAFQLADAALA